MTFHKKTCWVFLEKLGGKLIGVSMQGRTISVDWPTKTCIHQLWADIRCHLENLGRKAIAQSAGAVEYTDCTSAEG